MFYNGYYNIGPSINAASVNRFLGNQAAPYDPTAFQHDTENVYAGYAQYSGRLGKFAFLAGMRLESTFGVYRQAPGEANAVTFKHDYTSYFPSVQLKYDVTRRHGCPRGLFHRHRAARVRPDFTRRHVQCVRPRV